MCKGRFCIWLWCYWCWLRNSSWCVRGFCNLHLFIHYKSFTLLKITNLQGLLPILTRKHFGSLSGILFSQEASCSSKDCHSLCDVKCCVGGAVILPEDTDSPVMEWFLMPVRSEKLFTIQWPNSLLCRLLVGLLVFLNLVVVFCFLSKPYIIIFGMLIVQVQVVDKNHGLLLLL